MRMPLDARCGKSCGKLNRTTQQSSMKRKEAEARQYI